MTMNKVGTFIQNSNTSKTAATASVAAANSVAKKPIPKMINGKPNPAYKLQLSEKSKQLKEQIQNQETIKPDTSGNSSSGDLPTDIPDTPTPEVPKTDAKELLEKARKAKEAKDLAKAAKAKAQEAKLKKTPAIFFIKAFEFVDTEIFADGMKSMAEATEGARYYAWDQKGEMIDQIKKRDKDQPVVLVGHGFGADTAVEIAQELNTIDNGFRKIDLLVTLNSSGFNNDFIPQNVVKNLNYITADNGWTDDGPNIALNYHRTEVENFLRPEGHDELDDSTDIQIEVVEAMNRVLKK
jgi:hypothetical protein